MLYIATAIAIAAAVTTTSAPAKIHGVEVFTMTITQSPDDETGEAYAEDVKTAHEAGWRDSPSEAGEDLAEFEAERADAQDEPSNVEVNDELVRQVETLTDQLKDAAAGQEKVQAKFDKSAGEVKELKSALKNADKAAANAKDEIAGLKGQIETLTAELEAAAAPKDAEG